MVTIVYMSTITAVNSGHNHEIFNRSKLTSQP